MEESVIYQDILEKGEAIGVAKGEAIGVTKGEAIGVAKGEATGEARGRAKEARALLIRIGSKRLGAPDAQIQARLEAIASVAELEALADRLLEVETWQEVLK